MMIVRVNAQHDGAVFFLGHEIMQLSIRVVSRYLKVVGAHSPVRSALGKPLDGVT